MGGKPKAPVIVMPPPPAPVAATPPGQDPAVQAALPPPTPQVSPTVGTPAQRGSASQRGPAALAASQGMNNTVLTGARGLPGLPTETRRSSLLGL
jgi:hypothetical protein